MPAIVLRSELSLMMCLMMSFLAGCQSAGHTPVVRKMRIGMGWASNSINVATFRQSALTTHGDTQYAAYYDADGAVILARRKLNDTQWETVKTPYTGHVKDAHDVISIGVDGQGYLHMSWDHHGAPLHYVRGVAPGSLELTEPMAMTGLDENSVTYPEFFNLANGDLLFMYRDGASGNGQKMLNRYEVANKRWVVVQHPVISGAGTCNAYTNQIAIDKKGRWHLSWNWRETGDVATNHDLLYAVSDDEGKTWKKSTDEVYVLPILPTTAEIVWTIGQNHELINQCTMTVDAKGRPMMATYWRDDDSEVPQFRLVWHDGKQWRMSQVSQRTTPFSLSGGGTKSIPISRPKLAAAEDGRVLMFFRDIERGGRASVAVSRDREYKKWDYYDLTEDDLGHWEPTYDRALWESRGVIDLFVMNAGQGDGERLETMPPQPVEVVEWKP